MSWHSHQQHRKVPTSNFQGPTEKRPYSLAFCGVAFGDELLIMTPPALHFGSLCKLVMHKPSLQTFPHPQVCCPPWGVFVGSLSSIPKVESPFWWLMWADSPNGRLWFKHTYTCAKWKWPYTKEMFVEKRHLKDNFTPSMTHFTNREWIFDLKSPSLPFLGHSYSIPIQYHGLCHCCSPHQAQAWPLLCSFCYVGNAEMSYSPPPSDSSSWRTGDAKARSWHCLIVAEQESLNGPIWISHFHVAMGKVGRLHMTDRVQDLL